MADDGFVVATFYKLVELENYYDMKPEIARVCSKFGIKGTIILSEEGINSTVCAKSKQDMDGLMTFLSTDSRLGAIRCAISLCNYPPFSKMAIRLKPYAVNMGPHIVKTVDCGKKVAPEEWDQLIQRDDIATIDVRNTYEAEIGSFRGAVVSETEAFSEFPAWFDKWKETCGKKKFAICCTGGIRCEKAGGYIRSLGYEVYNLEFGILRYIEDKKNADSSMWDGRCFVFDDRIALDAQLTADPRCSICDEAPSLEDIASVSRARVICSKCKTQDTKQGDIQNMVRNDT